MVAFSGRFILYVLNRESSLDVYQPITECTLFTYGSSCCLSAAPIQIPSTCNACLADSDMFEGIVSFTLSIRHNCPLFIVHKT